MAEFVRICPKCHHLNPEYENLCVQCQQFIAMEPSVQRPQASPPPSPPPRIDEAPPIEAPQAVFYLRLGDRTLTVFDQFIIGQHDPGTSVQLPISSETEGYRYIHRQHCSFHYHHDGWYVKALNQRIFGQVFTNPTVVNKVTVAPASEHPLHHGDLLRLGAVEFLVQIP